MQEKKVTYQELARQAQKKEKHQIVLAPDSERGRGDFLFDDG